MNNKELLKELEEKFAKMKQELGFEANLDKLDRIFFIKDHILREGFVSNYLSRQICFRIVDVYISWTNYLHSLIMPNPQNMLNMGEAKIFSQEEKMEITELIKKAMEISSRSSLIGLTKDEEDEAKFIDEAVDLWKDIFKMKLTEIMKKINGEWGRE